MTIVGRKGHMDADGNYVCDSVKAEAVDEETGCAGWAWAGTDEEAEDIAQTELAKAVAEHEALQDPDVIEARARADLANQLARAEKLRAERRGR